MNELTLRDAIAIWDLRPNDWAGPYTTTRNVPLKSPGDLSDHEVGALRGIDLSLLGCRERIRLLDIIAIRDSGRERAEAAPRWRYVKYIDAFTMVRAPVRGSRSHGFHRIVVGCQSAAGRCRAVAA